jgi:16S rRNA processing protein RimM
MTKAESTGSSKAGAKKSSNLVDVGKVGAVNGIKGWVKIHSDTEPADNLFSYSPLWLKTRHGVKPMEIDEYRLQGKGWVAHFKGLDDREQAQALTGATIAVERAQMPQLEAGEFYWHQLQGLAVISEFEGQTARLGTVQRLLETGANDVLVVRGDTESVDQSERLIPYIPDLYVKNVDLDAGEIHVEWDPAF